MSKLIITKDHKFSLDGINIISVSKGEVIENQSPEFLNAIEKCSEPQTEGTESDAANKDKDSW